MSWRTAAALSWSLQKATQCQQTCMSPACHLHVTCLLRREGSTMRGEAGFRVPHHGTATGALNSAGCCSAPMRFGHYPVPAGWPAREDACWNRQAGKGEGRKCSANRDDENCTRIWCISKCISIRHF